MLGIYEILSQWPPQHRWRCREAQETLVPLPIFLPTVTFKFSYHFVLNLVTKGPISCLLEVLALKGSHLAGPHGCAQCVCMVCKGCVGVHGVHGALGSDTHRVWVNKYVFPPKKFLPPRPIKCLFVCQAVWPWSRKQSSNSWSYGLSSSTFWLMCPMLPGPFAGLWSLSLAM